MKVLWSWLLEMCDLDRVPAVEDGASALTRGGIAIDQIVDLGAGFRGVVVAEVVARRPHPQADKLTLVDVITERGGAATQVVCGAPNVPEPGRKVLWAQVGAELPGGVTLAAKPVKGIVSPGMLCAEDELGLSDDHAGIVVLDHDDATPLGAAAQRALGLDDHLLEVDPPANRGDLLGHLGVARELCAMLRGKLVLPDGDLTAFQRPGDPGVQIAIASAQACPRYVARVIDGLAIKPSPRRIAQRLRAVGVRPISNLVDVTNYVLFELGQPLHAFDAATLRTGMLRVTAAADAEPFTTLDGQKRTLVAGDLMIRDGDRGIALAGVMGGADTEITDATTRVLLESACFQPLLVRRTARRLNLRSEASQRFERGVDPELAALASARAARLLCQVGGGAVIGEAVDAYPGKRTIAPIAVRLPRVQAVTGVALDEATCRDALERLGFAVSSGFEVTPPSPRHDVTREVDVIEEILRVSGYDQVPSTLPALRTPPPVRPADRAELARAALAGAGAFEAITYGFQSVARCGSLGIPASDRRSQPIALRNPMTEQQSVMRTSLLPNLVAAVARNASFGRPDVALFEVGSVFLRRGEGAAEQPLHELADEPTFAAGVLAGRRPSGIGLGAPWDALDAKALALAAIRAVAGDVAVRARATTTVPYLHPGVAGELVIDRVVVGWFGELHPAVCARLAAPAPIHAFEVALDALALAPPAQMKPITSFPGSARDVSLLLAEDIPAGRIEDVIADADEPLVGTIRLLEDYRDPKLGAGMKSMLWSIGYRAPDRTLTDAEVDRAHEAIVARLVDNLPAQRR
ncbi:MAG TPA: phenylalanine--tRNA ligase subunit beta [Kofleriaceae bacterium]|nr:phenylalanine--tRNA ligase subunit beta [Kofleriaceae bacterium]